MFIFDHIALCDGIPRRGWVNRGIKHPETVGEHMRECVKIASEMADEFGVDCDHLMALLAVHDLPASDSSVGDIIPVIEGIIPGDGISPADKLVRERAAMEKICAGLPEGAAMLELWNEFEEGETPEAKAAKQINVYETVTVAKRYAREQGLTIDDFLADAERRITHPALKRRLDEMV